MGKEKLPKIKKRMAMYLQSEEGKITREQAAAVALSMMVVASSFGAAKSGRAGGYVKGLQGGARPGLHGSHASHGSHCSHGSHASHGSHGSHSSHGSHGSHGSHASHGSHTSHGSHSSHGSHGSW